MNRHLPKKLWRFFPGTLAALAIALLLNLGVFQPLEQIAYRLLFQSRSLLPWDERLVVVAIDDASLQQLGRFPWERQQYVKLLDVLSAADASVIAIDLLWSEPSVDDPQLAEAMMRQGRVVLAQAWDATGLPLLPVQQLRAAAIATGHVMRQADTDGLVRRVELQLRGQPALGVATLQSYSLVRAPVSFPNLDQPFWINWTAPAQQMSSYSFADVIQEKVPAQAFHNKIVLVGVTATGLDPLITPFDQNPPVSNVYLHATVMQNLLQQNSLYPVSNGGLWLIFLLGGPGLGWLMADWSLKQQLGLVAAGCLGWFLVSLLLLQANQLFPVAMPMILLITTARIVALNERVRETSLLQQQVSQLWHRYRQNLVIATADAGHPLVPLQKQELPQPPTAVLQVAQLAALAEQFGRSQATQAAIAQSLSMGLLAADLNGMIWFCNPAASQWLQVKVGSHLPDQLVPAWLSRSQWQICLQRLQSGNSVKHQNLQQGDRWFDMDLQPIVQDVVALPATPANPALEGFLVLLEEVTERQHTEMKLQQAKEIAVREATRSADASRAKSEFLANMSHELRTPLNAILGFTELMSHDPYLNQEHQEFLNIINSSGQHLLALINDVLEMSKIEAGRAKLHESSFDLYHLLDSLEEMMRGKATTKQLTLVFDRPADIPQYLTTDAGKLRQVLLNLLDNAIKFTQQGKVTLRVRVEKNLADSSAKPCILHFEVEDSGSGIAPEEIENLFQPFVQTATGQKSHEGTGLGLTISQKFINLMGGDIQVDSIVNQGSRFTFNIQAGCTAIDRVDSPLKTRRVIALAPNQAVRRVLIVDDRWENSQFLVRLLMPLGFAIREASNGQEGIAEWVNWQPHLILMDMRMPVLDGYEATRQIRQAEDKQNNRACKIIALSASVFEDTQSAVAAAGCDDFIRKPVREETLLDKLAEHLKIDYVYEETATLDQTNRGQPEMGKPETAPTATILQSYLAQMPADWITQLHQAAIKGFDHQIFQLIEEIPEPYSLLAQVLLNWNNGFQFDKITDLTQQVID
jgi:signal transduction histidine kinase/CHASE2 domain-containing sensor protein/FixJ family two-component response regulator